MSAVQAQPTAVAEEDSRSIMKDKKILITGGSRGIGATAVRRFSALGAEVAFLYKSSDAAAQALSSETGARAIKCDVSKPDEVAEAVGTILSDFGGKLDVLICNAGISKWGLVTDLGVDAWNEMINTNLNGAYYVINQVLPTMISEHRGNIITVSSMWGQVGASCEVAYSTAKAGLIGLTKALAKEVGPSGIRVNCIAPGMIDTEMNCNVSEEARRDIVDETPLDRIGRPEDVVDAMEFLASDRSDFITGQVLAVNGGLVI